VSKSTLGGDCKVPIRRSQQPEAVTQQRLWLSGLGGVARPNHAAETATIAAGPEIHAGFTF
jgi:hypothetical protein